MHSYIHTHTYTNTLTLTHARTHTHTHKSIYLYKLYKRVFVALHCEILGNLKSFAWYRRSVELKNGKECVYSFIDH